MEEAVAQKKRFYTKRDIPELYAQLLKEAGEIAQNRDMRRLIHRAMRIAQKSHAQQARKSGEPYIIHPITVARYATRICPKDIDVILAGLLHDVVEDSAVTVQDLQNQFPEREHLPQIVDGLTKFKDTEEHDGVDDSPQVATYRRLLTQTIEEDPRIILVKMADRLHNMQTLEFKEKSKQHKIASETLNVYVPIADRLGLYTVKSELEDLSFRFLNPDAYRNIEKLFEQHRERLTRAHRDAKERITRILEPTHLKYELLSRQKSPYSTDQKIKNKHIPFEQIYDLIALRIVFEPRPDIPEKTQCWFIYMLLTEHFIPLRERTRDWVSTPKVNGYEALHCTLMDKNGQWVEVQIRTRRMDDFAEHGAASHVLYKGEEDFGTGAELDEIRKRLSSISASYEMTSSGFMARFSTDLLSRMIVYERKLVESEEGEKRTLEPFSLPIGSFVLDFAYLKDKELGNQSLAARVNGILVGLDYKLLAGDEIEMISAPTQYPTKNWRKYVFSPLARNAIDQEIVAREARLIEKGRMRLYEIFNRLEEDYSEEIVASLLPVFYVKSEQELSQGLLNGVIDPWALRRKIRRALRRQKRKAHWEKITGRFRKPQPLETEGDVDKPVLPAYHFVTSPCCCALPGDVDVVGILDPESGENVLRVHKANCEVARDYLSQHGGQSRDFNWEADKEHTYPTHIYVGGDDRSNLLTELFSVFTRQNVNINITRADLRSDGRYFQGVLSFDIHDLNELKNLIQAIYRIDGIRRIYRLDVPSSYERVDKLYYR